MVMAHLQQEGFAPAPAGPAPGPGGLGALPETWAFLSHLAATAGGAAGGGAAAGGAAGAAAWGQQAAAPAQQAQQADLGALLYGFFDLYGSRFGYARDAVSIRLGGVTPKIRAWRQASGGTLGVDT